METARTGGLRIAGHTWETLSHTARDVGVAELTIAGALRASGEG
jgi:hypothetical protein